jgi:superfamily II DNA or RNA helicase
VFTETVPSANRAAATLSALGVSAKAYTGKLAPPVRKAMLEQFRAGTVRVIAAPRVLDEGIDVPEADVGVIVAGSRNRRQMIQRMGRIILPRGRQGT